MREQVRYRETEEQDFLPDLDLPEDRDFGISKMISNTEVNRMMMCC
jgi:hypothetical protein